MGRVVRNIEAVARNTGSPAEVLVARSAWHRFCGTQRLRSAATSKVRRASTRGLWPRARFLSRGFQNVQGGRVCNPMNKTPDPASQPVPPLARPPGLLRLTLSLGTSLFACAYFVHNIWTRLVPDPPYHSPQNERFPNDRDSCAQGDAEACATLAGNIEEYDKSSGGEMEAHSLYLKACDAGNTEACGFAAQPTIMRGRTSNATRALLRRACEGGDEYWCDSLAHDYATCDDDASVVEDAKRACDAGDRFECYRAATCYDVGSGVERDTRLAAIYKLRYLCVGKPDREACEKQAPILVEASRAESGAPDASREP